MTIVEHRFIDKAKWPAGPWHDEPDEKRWVDPSTGLFCLIARNAAGALCGYVGVPEGHPCFRKKCDAVRAHVHGGLTFAGIRAPVRLDVHQAGSDALDHAWWLGFDCAHAGDRLPILDHAFFDGDVYRDRAYVEAECASLARQLADRVKRA